MSAVAVAVTGEIVIQVNHLSYLFFQIEFSDVESLKSVCSYCFLVKFMLSVRKPERKVKGKDSFVDENSLGNTGSRLIERSGPQFMCSILN